MGERSNVVEVRIPCGDQIIEQSLRPDSHRAQRRERFIEIGLLGCHLGVGRGSGARHRPLSHDKERAAIGAQKTPDMPGILLTFFVSYKPLTW